MSLKDSINNAAGSNVVEKIVLDGTTEGAEELVEKAVKKSMTTSAWAVKAGFIAGAAILAAGAIDYGMKIQDRQRVSRETERQRYQEDKVQRASQKYKDMAYRELLGNLPMELYKDRTGHTNSWGGRQY